MFSQKTQTGASWKSRAASLCSSLIFLGLASSAHAWIELRYQQTSHPQNLFANQQVNQASFSYQYMPYTQWRDQGAGRFFPMEISPVIRGMVEGNVQAPGLQGVNARDFQDQAQEFFNWVNERNRSGRVQVDIGDSTPQEVLRSHEAGNHVIETVISAVIDRPFSSLELNKELIMEMAAEIDFDHYHFQIPGSYVSEVLEDTHVAHRTIRPNGKYLLSVIDFRDYECGFIRNGIRDYFSRNPDSERLQNDSIYMISEIDYNNSEALARAASYFGKRPDAIATQQVIFSSHLIRAANTTFAFFAEGNRTRLVLVSNMAMRSRFFTGRESALVKPYLFGGVGGVTGQVIGGAYNVLSGLISGASDTMSQRNTCQKGVATGLTNYSQSLFTAFVNFVAE